MANEATLNVSSQLARDVADIAFGAFKGERTDAGAEGETHTRARIKQLPWEEFLKTAKCGELKPYFRKLARAFHPDTTGRVW